MARRPPPLRTVKSGLGRLAATVVGPSTELTEVAHRSPTRIIPIGTSAVQRAGAALAAVSSYGGGMVRGDGQELHVAVDEGAKLGLVTQGATRIYRRSGYLSSSSSSSSLSNTTLPASASDGDNANEDTCHATLHATIKANGLLVVAPDPLVPFSQSSFAQCQTFELDADASLVLVDWFGAGRVVNGERWDFDYLSSRSDLMFLGTKDPFLIESISLDRRRGNILAQDDPFCFTVGPNTKFDAFASIILHGSAVEEVSKRFEALSKGLAGEFTRVRSIGGNHVENDASIGHDLALGGRVLLGFSKVEHYKCSESQQPNESTYVARLATTTNEDMYRVLHDCMLPLKEELGTEFYKDRIHGSSAYKQVNGFDVSNKKHDKIQKTKRFPQESTVTKALRKVAASSFLDGHASWCAFMLADSGLPTGSFAHSASIESASQLGLFGPPSNPELSLVSSYINAAARSAVQAITPFVLAGHSLSTLSGENVDDRFHDWCRLDRFAHAALAANGPGCKASLDQGHGVLRVAIQWLESDAETKAQSAEAVAMLRRIQEEIDYSPATTGHIGPLFGLIGGFLGIDSDVTCRVLGYCTARDMISAAVRLNLVGPIAGVTVLHGVNEAVDDGIVHATSSITDNSESAGMDDVSAALKNVATCSPVVESIHPTHDILAVRLFRT